MIIGHLPAGCIVSVWLFPRLRHCGVGFKAFLLAGLLGAVAPDIDMLYFHWVDHRQHHHHTYATHFPIVWAALCAISIAWWLASKRTGRATLAVVFSLNGFIHILLDSVVGDVWWGAPFFDTGPFALASVPARFSPWWLNFMLHWSFGLELALVAGAVVAWRLKGRLLLGRGGTALPAHPETRRAPLKGTSMQIKFSSVMVQDQAHALRFYTEVLGFEKVSDIPMGEHRWLTVRSPDGIEGVELVLEPMAFAPARTYQQALFDAGIPALAFITQDITAEVQRLQAGGVRLRGEPVRMGPVTVVMFEDTCGNLVNLVQPGG